MSCGTYDGCLQLPQVITHADNELLCPVVTDLADEDPVVELGFSGPHRMATAEALELYFVHQFTKKSSSSLRPMTPAGSRVHMTEIGCLA